MNYWYWILFLLGLCSCQSLQLCQQTTVLLQKNLDSNYWTVKKVTSSTIQIHSKKKFGLLVYYPEMGWADLGKRRPLEGFSYRTFEAPYKIELTFKPKTYKDNTHIKKELHRNYLITKDNPRSTPFPRKKFVYQQIPIVLTTQFDDGGSISGLEHLEGTSQSAVQLDSLIYHVNQHFDTPTELEAWSSKQVLTKMPASYLDSIQTGTYYTKPTGGIVPNWGGTQPFLK